MNFQFGNVVVVDGGQIGVIVKTWEDGVVDLKYSHDVYVRNLNEIKCYSEEDIRHFIYSKELADEERESYEA